MWQPPWSSVHDGCHVIVNCLVHPVHPGHHWDVMAYFSRSSSSHPYIWLSFVSVYPGYPLLHTGTGWNNINCQTNQSKYLGSKVLIQDELWGLKNIANVYVLFVPVFWQSQKFRNFKTYFSSSLIFKATFSHDLKPFIEGHFRGVRVSTTCFIIFSIIILSLQNRLESVIIFSVCDKTWKMFTNGTNLLNFLMRLLNNK